MSIHDIDKNSAGRDSPMPNSHDEQGLARMAHGTLSINPVTDASPTVGWVETKNGQIIIHDATNVRMIVGVLPDGSYGWVISRAGYDVSQVFS